MNLLGTEDLRKAWDLAFKLHLKGLNAVMGERVQSSLDDVLKAVRPSRGGSGTNEE